jgi:DNA-binding FadR family transcriptional regulator
MAMDAAGTGSMHAFEPVVRAPHVHASIAEQILDRITSGAAPVGSRLPSETDLAREFGVSRPSVREALAALQFAGHVESRRGFGTVVVSKGAGETTPEHLVPLTTLNDAVDVLEARLVLEPNAIAIAATDPDPAALKVAARLISGMRTAVDDRQLHVSTDILVHRALLDACRNPILRTAASELANRSLDPMLSTIRTQAWSSPDLPHVWADQHDVVYQALLARDPVAARAGVLAHLASVVDNLSAATRADPSVHRRMTSIWALTGAVERTITHPRSSPAHEGVDAHDRHD